MSKKITLVSSDNKRFEVEEEVIIQSQLVKNMIDGDECADGVIPLSNVHGDTLVKVIEYLKKHADNPFFIYMDDDVLKAWDADFVNNLVVHKTIRGVIMAAQHMDIKSLMDLTCQKVADMMIGKSAEELRRLFGIKNDFTAEEEEEVRLENQWLFGN